MGSWDKLFGSSGAAPASPQPDFAAKVRAWESDALRKAVTTFRSEYSREQLAALDAELARRGEQTKVARSAPRAPRAAGDDRDRSPTSPAMWLPQLRLQVFREQGLHMQVVDQASVVRRPLAPGLVEVLVLDEGGLAERTLPRENAWRSGLDDDALFARARAQAVASDIHENQFQEVPQLPGVFVAVSNRFYLSACMLEVLARRDWPHGDVVAPVSWHHWVQHEVRPGATSLASLTELARFVRHLAGSIDVSDAEHLGDGLYWVPRGGPWQPIPVTGGDEPVVTPPAGLAALLD